MHYLQYLARREESHIHPGGERATGLLLRALGLRPGDTVLELGCGTGATLLRAASQTPTRIVGLDAMPEMLAAAQRRVGVIAQARRPSLVGADITQLPFAESSFDRAYAESVLGMQDAHSIIATLRELHRVLKPGAICVINDAIWKAGTTDAAIAAANRSCEESFGLRQASQEPWRLHDWCLAIRGAGFQLQSSGLLAAQLRPRTGGRALWAMRRRLQGLARLCAMWRAESAEYGSAQRRYAWALWQQRALGQLIEARMFVLVRA